jgi:lysophospholipase L1-like esterase
MPEIASSPGWFHPETFHALSSAGDKVSQFAALAVTALSAAPQHLVTVQRFGEDIFAATFLIAVLQAAVALLEYQNNPGGELMVPPGLTVGVESPHDATTEIIHKERTRFIPKLHNHQIPPWFPSFKKFHAAVFDKSVSDSKKKNSRYTFQSEIEKYSAVIETISRSLVLLFPFATSLVSFLLERNTHLFHLGFIVSLAQLWEIPNQFFFRQQKQVPLLPDIIQSIETHAPNKPKLPQRVVVIGDSLVVGLGTVNVFDKEQQIESRRSENLESDIGPGPVFPKILAQTIARTTNQPVHWRSAGVNGGDTKEIEEYCLDVIREEVEKGHAPDLVVLVSGINDLKHYASNPFRNPGAREFRSRLSHLISNIRELAPNATIVLPALPTQMFRRKSPLNIFPLVFFLNGVVGFWDSQKKVVAGRFHNSEVLYIGISPKEILEWYFRDSTNSKVLADADFLDGVDDMALISADGVHPNARCYALWAESLAIKVLKEMQPKCSEEQCPPGPMVTGHKTGLVGI